MHEIATAPAPPQIQEMPSPEQALGLLTRPRVIGKPRKPPTSKKCRCGRIISANAIACRSCMLDGIDKSLAQMDEIVTKQTQIGEFTQANAAAKAQTKLQQLRTDVRKGYRKVF